MNILPRGISMIRAALISGVALSVTACANEPLKAPMMMLNGPAHAAEASSLASPADPMHELSRKSLAAKVLTSRALETVTGLPIDPARFSEHD